MNEDELAAVVAAAHLLFPRADAESTALAQTRWNVAGRMRTQDAPRAGIVARSRSRWMIGGRLRD